MSVTRGFTSSLVSPTGEIVRALVEAVESTIGAHPYATVTVAEQTDDGVVTDGTAVFVTVEERLKTVTVETV